MKHIVAILITVLFCQAINAQNIFNMEKKNKAIYSRFGIEPTYVFAIGYMQAFDLKSINRKVLTYGDLSSPTKMFGIKNYEAKAGGVIEAISWKGIGVTYNLNFSTGHVQTKNFGSQKFSFGNKLSCGYYKDKWYLAFIGQYEKIIANNLTHTQYYRDYVFPEAKDGWYKGAGGNIQFGLETGFTLKEYLDIRFELKLPKSEKFDSYNGSPAHTNLTIAYRF